MRPDEALALAHITMGYLQRLDRAESRKQIDDIMGEFSPWAKSKRVAPQIREHVEIKARSLAAEMPARNVSDRTKAMTGDREDAA